MSNVNDRGFSTTWPDKVQVFELAFDQHWDELFRHAYRKTQTEDLSKDLVQETFMVLWNGLDNLDLTEKVLPLLYGILRNKILKQYEKSEVHFKYALSVSQKDEQFDISSENLLLTKELESVIFAEVEKMPVRMKEIYLLKKEEGFSIKEIAEKLGLSEQTVKNQLQNAYSRLRLCLKEYNSSLFFVGFVVHYAPLLLHC
ncbi:RNA polymerase sigma factor [Mucilaginibacter jinjuensis]|uniref:Sigma-70 family RNA polymerase sigma factor n=1 Tax=Mucilaginibacter jinjuensis TaxID=1176721 RepID=A0ABY7T4I6_9SPHI|nr:sigma-70 family RNA polymerase sigma factor [Mucilaginibacter jinjuensis]WCT10703.1 sigma-70 family RNA polymerase sigma factor [Mucilaginibacter jinjuensis]